MASLDALVEMAVTSHQGLTLVHFPAQLKLLLLICCVVEWFQS
jgi:hypothetical protein